MKPLALFTLAVLSAQAQSSVTPSPDCQINISLTANGNAPATQVAGGASDNRQTGCTFWQLSVSNSTPGLTTPTVTFQSAPDAGGTPGTWGTFSGGTLTGSTNPVTVSAGTSAFFTIVNGYNP